MAQRQQEWLTQKYHVSPGIRSVSVCPFSNIGLQDFWSGVVLQPLKKQSRPADRGKKDQSGERIEIQDARHFNP